VFGSSERYSYFPYEFGHLDRAMRIKFKMSSGSPETAMPGSLMPIKPLNSKSRNRTAAGARRSKGAVAAESPVLARPPKHSQRLSAVNEVAANRDPKLTQIVYEKILNAIVYGLLDLGEPLSENDLAQALKVSKAPIRESLNELRIKGLVVVVPQSGSYVFSPTGEQIEELCDVRSLLETRALAASMERNPRSLIADLRKAVTGMQQALRTLDLFRYKCLDTEYHQAFLRHCGNQYLIQLYSNIGLSVEALRYRFMDTAIYRNLGFDEHKKIVELLAANNIPKAIDVLQDHIARTRNFKSNVSWSTGRLRRKDYKFRDYAKIFSEE
jgi:DNA-binding GntR family transcriptional regulator